MKNTVERTYKSPVKFVAWIVALAVFSACLLAGICALFAQNNRQKMTLENHYRQVAYELADSANNLENDLAKLLVSRSTAENIGFALDAYRQSESAVSALCSLPVNQLDVEGATKFYNQVGDFCKSYSSALAHGRSGEKYEALIEDMFVTARAINQQVNDFVAMMNREGYKITAHISPNPPHGKSEDMQHNSVEYPELIYDGPFSDSTTPRSYLGLEKLGEVTIEQAKDAVRATVPSLNISQFTELGESVGDAPAYELSAATDLGDAYFSVSKTGGKVLNMTLSRDVGKPMLSETSAKQCAVQIAAQFGYDVQPIWYNEADGVAFVNLAPIEDEIVYYTDLVKVKVGLDNGGVLGLEATGYCMNHHARQEHAKITMAEAKDKVWPHLSVQAARLAVIPVGSAEALCWEVAAEYKGLDYFIYVDALTGEQAKILRVIDEGQGKLTI